MADAKRVAQPGGDRERHRLALALQQGIGRDGGAHLHRGNLAAARLGEDRGDSRDRGIVITFGIFGQQLADHALAGRAVRDDIGEGAAAIDREGPAP